jgi:hypothetical protein
MNKAKMYGFAMWLIAAALLGATWAQQSSSTSITVSAGGVGTGQLANISTEGITGPSWSPIEGAVGSVTAGNLYKIQVPDSGQYMITLFLTDVDELVQAYSYLNLNVTIYAISSDDYNNASLGQTLPAGATLKATEWLTLSSGRVILYVTGSAYYLVRVDDGVFYCTSTSDTDNLGPEFYIMVDQA